MNSKNLSRFFTPLPHPMLEFLKILLEQSQDYNTIRTLIEGIAANVT